MESNATLYAHRHNEDDTYDTICRTCFAALARRKPESQLAQYESAHICDSSFLAERGYFHQSESLSRSAPSR